MRKLLLALLAVVVAAAAAGAIRAARLTPEPASNARLDADVAKFQADPAKLAGALQRATVSPQDSAQFDPAPFLSLHQYLEQSFPQVHRTLRREVVASYSLLYTWPGSDSTLAPVLLMSHLDVVPVVPGTEGAWERSPFGGVVDSGFVWGRGALDDKVGVVAILEAAEQLLSLGFAPQRTVLFAFGHDEEIGGWRGAAALSATIRERHGRVSFLLDEGGFIGDGVLAGVRRPVALVGVAEKSFASLELSVAGAGGHSSIPPRHTAVGVLARAITRLEEHQMPARLTSAVREMFSVIAPELPFGQRFVMANANVLRPVLTSALTRVPQTNALVRTTTAATMFTGSPKDNVLPISATAVVNFRILPGDSVAHLLEHVRRTVDDTTVRVRVLGTPREPSPVADTESPEWAILKKTILQTVPEALVAPNLLVGATDTRHYESLTRNVYRFFPIRVGLTEFSRVHGTGERVKVAEYQTAVRFYAQLLRNSSRGSDP